LSAGTVGDISILIELMPVELLGGHPMEANRTATSNPPALLKLLAHGVRWQLLAALSHSDRTVSELRGLVGRPDNLVSYHLGRLREAGLVTERRSDADGRDVYYSLDVERLRRLYLDVGTALHPALFPSVSEAAPNGTVARLPRVLFLCTGNSARSQMAEALLRDVAKGRVEVRSAGIAPSVVDSDALRAIGELGIDISDLRSKHLDEFADERFDYVVTVCDRMKESCPTYPGDTTRLHWSFADPAAVDGPPEERLRAFRDTSLQLLTRIRLLMTVIERDSVVTPS
jgi:ArsR family transcriptional regulator, arsenate/arsenite/antimonite-responsive transcriptional repressor / arsenate reductase (thioredoxin)